VIGTGTLAFIVLLSVIARSRILLLTIQKITGIFNEKVRNKLRNSFWGLILVFQRIIQDQKLLRQYIIIVFSSWVFTYAAIFILALGIQNEINPKTKIIEYVPFMSFIILNSNNLLGVYSSKVNELSDLITPLSGANNFLENFSLLSWLVFVLPFFVIGVYAIISFFVKTNSDLRYLSDENYTEEKSTKLIAPSEFLDSFFSKEIIIESIHRRSILENFKVLEYFKGGSDAVTMLVEKSPIKLVQKVAGPQGAMKLKSQLNWLQSVNSDGIVKVIGSKSSDGYFTMELQYIDNSVSLFEYVHTHSIDSSKQVILKALEILIENVYGQKTIKKIDIELREYLNSNLNERIIKVASVSKVFNEFLDTRNSIIINGKQFIGLQTIVERICSSEKCWEVLTSMQVTDRCHGDFTVDNILVRTHNDAPVLIDPSDDNLLKGPLFDLSRLMQSFLGGYEFLNQNEFEVNLRYNRENLIIDYYDTTSNKYSELSDWLFSEVMPSLLSKSELQAIKFHVGVFYARMLTHRLQINESTLLKYAAVSTRLLNEFYEEVGSKDE
jgi:hypothetical protein